MLIVANLVATVLRFVLLRGWVFRDAPRARRPEGADERHPAEAPYRPRRRAPAAARPRRGRRDPAWVRPALLALLAGTALLYLVGPRANGWAN